MNILTNNVTKTNRKAERITQLNIDREGKAISKTLHLEESMERYAERPAFISLKDHKENFKHNTKCRLINPSKGKMGVVSKRFLEEINNKLNKHLCYNQGHSTSTVIEWFRAIENKKPVNSLNLTLQSSTRQYQQNYLKNPLILQEASSK